MTTKTSTKPKRIDCTATFVVGDVTAKVRHGDHSVFVTINRIGSIDISRRDAKQLVAALQDALGWTP